MSTSDSYYYLDHGIVLEITFLDAEGREMGVQSATRKVFIFQDPNGNRWEKPAAFSVDGADGRIRYTVEPGFLKVIGTWVYQAQITTSTGRFASDKFSFRVLPLL